MKLIVPLDVLMKQMPIPLPGLFVRFLGAAEVLGAIGLIFPGLRAFEWSLRRWPPADCLST